MCKKRTELHLSAVDSNHFNTNIHFAQALVALSCSPTTLFQVSPPLKILIGKASDAIKKDSDVDTKFI